MDVISHQPSTVYASTFGDILVHLRKHTTPGTALPSPAHFMTMGSASLGVDGTRKRRENGSRGNPNTDRAKKWENEVRVGLDGETVKRKVASVLRESQKIRNGCLGKNGVAEQRIERTPGT